ncbi:3-oxoacyl-ACP synthase [Winogradskyella sp.]|uniref:3-oxoacyl-ACP synthase n=1 Tax=Winogradskyella sp. TaxID=1883156 RepID=UPI003516AF31
MKTKQQLYNKCNELIDNRLKIIQNNISDIQKALQSETKSSAVDKHETGRAMLQLERERLGNQLAEAKKLQESLRKLQTENTYNKVAFGSLVRTNQLNYFIAVSLGEIKIDNESFYIISPETPVGKLLVSKSVGDQIAFRNSTFVISKIE